MLGGRHVDHEAELHVGDPRFDDWPVVRDFEDLTTALAWRRQLTDARFDAVVTSDWRLDEFGRGDIALRVPPDEWVDADELLAEPE
jgi:hypothetical protein